VNVFVKTITQCSCWWRHSSPATRDRDLLRAGKLAASPEDDMKLSFCAASAAIVLTTTTAASADPILILTLVREARVSVAVSDSSGSDSGAATDQNDSPLVATAFVSTTLSSAASNATLTTQIDNTLNWFGFGTANSLVSTTGTGTFFARSAFLVTFDVLTPLEYAFSGNFDAEASPTGGAPPNRGVSTWGFQLDLAGDPVFSGIGTGEATRSFVGLLEPGRYTLSLATEQEVEVAGRTGFGTGGFSFTFDMSPVDEAVVPEPATLLLTGAGLAGAFTARRLKRT
jgi:hypothetical protein